MLGGGNDLPLLGIVPDTVGANVPDQIDLLQGWVIACSDSS